MECLQAPKAVSLREWIEGLLQILDSRKIPDCKDRWFGTTASRDTAYTTVSSRTEPPMQLSGGDVLTMKSEIKVYKSYKIQALFKIHEEK